MGHPHTSSTPLDTTTTTTTTNSLKPKPQIPMSRYQDAVERIASTKEWAHHEQAVRQQPYEVSLWLSYLDAIDEMLVEQGDDLVVTVRDLVARRALQKLPKSYKIWKDHWEFSLQQHRKGLYTNATLVACFEACLQRLAHMPRVWIVYFTFLSSIGTADMPLSLTQARRTMNRALQALPVTQHHKVWPSILEWLHQWPMFPVESVQRVLQRYTLLDPSYQSDYATWCQEHGQWAAAAAALLDVLNQSATSTTMDATQQAWQAFTDVCTLHSREVEAAGIPWERILRTALQQAETKKQQTASSSTSSSSLTGLIYSQLATAWIRRGAFGLARTVYEEGLHKVTTVRDFVVLFAAYLQFEEGLLEAATEAMEDFDDDDDDDDDDEEEEDAMDESNDKNEQDDDDWDLLLETAASSKLADMELALARAEHLTARRPIMLNAVLLRQNPNHVGEWLNRADLYIQQKQYGQAAHALQEGLAAVKSAVGGRVSQLVTKLVTVYDELLHDPDRARDLLDQICNRQDQNPLLFSKVEELAECWAAWIELELRRERWDDALSLARQSVASGAGTRKVNLTKSLRLWDLLLDLEESLGTVQTTKDAYNRALEIRTATAQHVLNFGSFLTEHKYFEESFAAYERGVELFAFPHAAAAKLIWKAYLDAFQSRYGGTKVERTRDLYQRCLEKCPPEESAEFFVMNGEFEEKHGLAKRALSVYKAMCQKVPAAEKYVGYQLYIAKTTKYLGLTSTRDIYQEAIEILENEASAKMCLDFAKMESSIQQIERARAILAYGAQMADPRRMPDYWKAWNDFEIGNGNEETFREMLRIKRSVEAAFSTVNYNASGMNEKVEAMSNEEAISMIASREGVDVEEQRSKVSGFVPSTKRPAAQASLDDVEQKVAKLRKMTGAAAVASEQQQVEVLKLDNDDEIDIDDIDAEIEEAAAEGAAAEEEEEEDAVAGDSADVTDIKTKAIPAAVFGGLKSAG